MTEMRELQRAVNAFVSEYRLESSLSTRLLDLVSEVGELAKEVLKGSSYGRRPENIDREKWTDELGDVLFVTICLANHTDVALDAALAGALEKYRARLTKTGDSGSGR